MKLLHKIIIRLTYSSPVLFLPFFFLKAGERLEYGKNMGTLSLILFIITLIPSMIRRFGLAKEFSLLIKFTLPVRRQFGILMFMTAFTHYLAMKVIPTLQYKLPPSLPVYQAFGLLALIFSFALFITSNNWATRKLKSKWKKLHRLTYVIGWLIFGHVLLIGLRSGEVLSLQALAIGFVMILEMASLIKARVSAGS
ncbi:MAG: ferric reductase-like transmembrane domain-containing protein [Candidatus Paceibacterota bacterium]